ncbi:MULTISPECIES: ABC transporter ATP-binding protein [unclassified Methanosarcina]|uniref:ABC transporter ATP-binding protein n=1 Tax=unclassified Methanosarcina TaxID=2644672 RepID=UPI00061599C3|nr:MULTISPECIES: ABC transporter ATP-binding protein [unclassified Methanosarcina]AKB17927.1 Duplicated ATPase component of energizing module of predicted tryptophan ECF transporter [Methanosarcina sp. WWM596]AKB21267.1 Duplicated ATPase component of energizing module of predicted tryptophan ECF transporter [Methanosarcina sp. WH1]
MIKLRNFSYTYGTAESPALKNINLEVRKGELLLVTGHSAAGKTTLALAMAGILHHEIGGKIKGSISFKNRDIKEFDGMKELSRHIGMVFDDAESQLIFTTVEEEILSGLENHGHPEKEILSRLKEAMEFCEISHLKNRAPHTLSGGQKQKAALAATLALDTEVLILDEATAELDLQAVRKVFSVLKSLKEAGKTIIIVDHNIEDFLEIGDRVVLLEKGEIKSIKSPSDFTASSSELTSTNLTTSMDFTSTSALTTSLSITRKGDQPIISVKKLTQRYGEVLALDSVDLDIYPGELIAILGENGSGKTTLVKHFDGLLHPYSGGVTVKGLDTSTVPINELVKHTGLVFQNPDNMLFEDTVEAEVNFGLNNIGVKGPEATRAILHSLELVNLSEKQKVFPRHLSRGERQRLAVACVIAMKPELIVLDEPTTGLDAEESDRMMQLMRRLQQEGHTIVMVTHNLQIVRDHVERVIRMESGKIVEDSVNRKFSGKECFSKECVSKECFSKECVRGGTCA